MPPADATSGRELPNNLGLAAERAIPVVVDQATYTLEVERRERSGATRPASFKEILEAGYELVPAAVVEEEDVAGATAQAEQALVDEHERAGGHTTEVPPRRVGAQAPDVPSGVAPPHGTPSSAPLPPVGSLVELFNYIRAMEQRLHDKIDEKFGEAPPAPSVEPADAALSKGGAVGVLSANRTVRDQQKSGQGSAGHEGESRSAVGGEASSIVEAPATWEISDWRLVAAVILTAFSVGGAAGRACASRFRPGPPQGLDLVVMQERGFGAYVRQEQLALGPQPQHLEALERLSGIRSLGRLAPVR